MNASKQVHTLELACKIAQISLLFQQEFSDAKVDLSPWLDDPDTQSIVDPDSIDLSFNFPGRKPNCQSCSILVQIRFSNTLTLCTAPIIGIEMSGHDHLGQQWRLSTVSSWQCQGKALPTPYAQQQLKQFCFNVFQLFRDPESNPVAISKETKTSEETEVVEQNGDRYSAEPHSRWNSNSVSDPKPNLEPDSDPECWEPCDWTE